MPEYVNEMKDTGRKKIKGKEGANPPQVVYCIPCVFKSKLNRTVRNLCNEIDYIPGICCYKLI